MRSNKSNRRSRRILFFGLKSQATIQFSLFYSRAQNAIKRTLLSLLSLVFILNSFFVRRSLHRGVTFYSDPR